MIIKHIYITVHSDMKKELNFEGTLADMACIELNKKLAEIVNNPRIIFIKETTWTSEIHTKENNSSTWYNRDYLRLSVYYEDKVY